MIKLKKILLGESWEQKHYERELAKIQNKMFEAAVDLKQITDRMGHGYRLETEMREATKFIKSGWTSLAIGLKKSIKATKKIDPLKMRQIVIKLKELIKEGPKDNDKVQVPGIGMYTYKTLKKDVQRKAADLAKQAKQENWMRVGRSGIRALAEMWDALDEYERKFH